MVLWQWQWLNGTVAVAVARWHSEQWQQQCSIRSLQQNNSNTVASGSGTVAVCHSDTVAVAVAQWQCGWQCGWQWQWHSRDAGFLAKHGEVRDHVNRRYVARDNAHPAKWQWHKSDNLTAI
jgi:hypothetical protein